MTGEHRHAALAGLTVLERGWLSSNNLLIHPARGEAGVVLVDTGHSQHAGQTVALVNQALAGAPLSRIVNTHLHSDHCGANAALQRVHAARITVAPGQAAAVRAWTQATLKHEGEGQFEGPFWADDELEADAPLLAGGREWQVIAAPGHDPDSVVLFEPGQGLLVSADALWEHGFGLVFPELQGEPGFDDVAATLDLIAGLPVKLVVPGHGRPFTDVAAALARARQRLAGFRADPARHARHGVKVMLKYRLMQVQRLPLAELLAWAVNTPVAQGAWAHHRPAGVPCLSDWVLQLLEELAASGALAREGDQVVDRA